MSLKIKGTIVGNQDILDDVLVTEFACEYVDSKKDESRTDETYGPDM